MQIAAVGDSNSGRLHPGSFISGIANRWSYLQIVPGQTQHSRKRKK